MAEETHKSLGTNVTPINYKITFEPDLKRFVYKGVESIIVSIKKPTSAIRLNAHELKIRSAMLLSKRGTYKGSVRYNDREQEITVKFPKAVSGSAQLYFEFDGVNNDKLYGFYRSKYTNNGKEGYILTSQFEAADARHAFPCFDEPEFKATFDINFIIDKGLEAISNMPVKSSSPAKRGKKFVSFRTTPKMSSYLVYLGVGKFESISGRLGSLKVRVVTVPGKIKLAKMALGFTKESIDYYQKYFGIKFPLPKMDMIAIPDFAAGAMENWGAITFREAALLGDEKGSSVGMKQYIADVVAHELAHQWFGDLVTMKWWNDLWLNESFATFMSAKAVHAVHPEWEMDVQYILDTVGTALSADQLNTTHPISVKVNDPGEIDEIFDEISYEKGGSFLSMLEDYVGAETFRKGLHHYLERFKYSNGEKNDLWDSVSWASRGSGARTNVRKVASYWIDNPGYPIVNVSYGKAAKGIELSQHRYLLLRKRDYNEVWPIPLHYSDGIKQGFMLFDSRAARLDSGYYVKLNLSQKGLYRVNYPEQMLNELGKSVKNGILGPLDGWGVENDLYSLLRSCRIPLERYLNFVEHYCMNSDYPLSASVSGHLDGLALLLYGKRDHEKVNSLNIKYHRRLLDRLGWERKDGERNVITMLRAASLMVLGTSGQQDVIDRAKRMFEDRLKMKVEIDPNIRGAVYRIVAWNGDADTFGLLSGLYEKEQNPEEKRRLLGSLGSFGTPDLIKRSLEFTLSKSVRIQDSQMIPAIASSNEVGKELIWDWTRSNWQRLMKIFNPGTHMLSRMVGNLSLTDTKGRMGQISSFFSEKRNHRRDIEKELRQTMEMIEVNINFARENP